MVSLPAREIISKIREKETFVSIVNEFGISKSTIVLKIATVKLINKYPNSSLSFHFLKKIFEVNQRSLHRKFQQF